MKKFLPAAALLGLAACTARRASTVKTSNSTAVVTQSIMLPDVPSGSAIRAADDGSFWIVSDDAPYLYRVSSDGRTLDSIRLAHLTTALHRIPKAEKPDYEAAVITEVDGRECLLAFGSGSHETSRDSMSIIPLRGGDGTQGVYSLSAIYERIRKTIGIAVKDFNIEGAALESERLILFNRGTGHLITFDRRAFLDEVLGRGGGPAPEASRVELPAKDSFPPGFSDGAFIDKNHLLFCASAEATTDWYADGEVLGSYIGLLDLANPAKPRLLRFSALVDKDGKPVKDKLEGIDLVREKGGTIYEVVGVVDNDDGTSKLLHIQVDGL